jgi:diguanylate cyclase (GGDEF)-like protein
VVRAHRGLVARWRDTEFVISLPNSDLDSARRVAERLQSLVSKEEFRYQNVCVPLTISAGVAATTGRDDRGSVSALCEGAERFLRQAQSMGRNHCIHS